MLQPANGYNNIILQSDSFITRHFEKVHNKKLAWSDAYIRIVIIMKCKYDLLRPHQSLWRRRSPVSALILYNLILHRHLVLQSLCPLAPLPDRPSWLRNSRCIFYYLCHLYSCQSHGPWWNLSIYRRHTFHHIGLNFYCNCSTFLCIFRNRSAEAAG